jgi:hypothetical protein
VTSAVAAIGLTYAGVDLQRSDLQIFLEIAVGLGEVPSVRGTDIIVPGLGGRIEGTRVKDVLPLELRGHVRADPAETTTAGARASFAANRATLRSLFASDRLRADLVATLEDSTVLTISARPLSIVWNEQVVSEFALLSVELEGYDDWAEVTGS